MHARMLVALVVPVVGFAFVSLARAADDVRLEVALDVGYTYMSARGSISEPAPASTGGGPSTPAPSGNGNFADSGFAVGGRFSVVAPYYGPGVPMPRLRVARCAQWAAPSPSSP